MTSMMAPAAMDSQSLQFRQLCKLQTLNDNTKNLYKNRTHLVATCSLYGLIFVGEKSGFKVIISNKIYEDNRACNPKTITQAYIHRNIVLPSAPTHIDVNSDQKLLSVTFTLNETPVLRIYNIESFFLPNLMVMNEVRLSSLPGACINDLIWNPGNPAVLACCISDGTLTVYTFGPGSNVAIKGLPKESNSTCACWSPKGKQIVVGNINGFLTQYTPELKAMKNYPPPSNVFNKPCTITSLKWLSPFQFIGVYSDQQQCVSNDEEIKTSIVVVNTPKNGPITYISYEDICYSSGTTRPNQFYFLHVAQWNVVFVASANAIEVGVLSLSPDENVWYQWNLDESYRVILPMNKTEETFPVGVAIDYSSQIQTPIGDSLIPMPVFVVLTDEGLLCLYVINNFAPNTPCICVKPNPEPTLQCFTNNNVCDEGSNQQQEAPPKPPPVSVPPVSAPPFQQMPASAAPQLGFASNNPPNLAAPVSFNPTALSANTFNVFAGMPLMNANTNISSTQVKSITQTVSFSTVSQHGHSQIITQTSTVIKKKDSEPLPIQTPQAVKYPPAMPQTPPLIPQTPPEDAIQKAANLQKIREEALKKLKKRASTFESEIQSFKSLTSNLKVNTDNRPCDGVVSQFEAKNRKLNEHNDEVRNEIDNLKTSIIEITACVKDIKSQHFLLTNPGYRSLTSAESLDSASAASLKNIEKNIYYVQSQIELVDKQLDEMWYKFCENSPESTTKIPKLENIYRTIVVQQKILKIRKLEMQSLEKKLKEMRYRMSLVQPSSDNFENDYSTKSYENFSSKEDLALAELTRKVLSLNNESNAKLDANSVSQKCAKEYAKRFTLSASKQTKLQELHGAHTVNYIRSAKLQRLKKKSLIILSKSANVPESCPAEVQKPPAHTSEILRQQLISPVSSDDGASDRLSAASVVPAIEKAVSSTPVKGRTGNKMNVESTFVEEPSVIVQLADEPPKLEPEVPQVVLSLPSSISAFRVNKPLAENVVVEKPAAAISAVPKQPADKENVAQPAMGVATSTTSLFGSSNRIFQNTSPVVSSTIVSSAPSSSLFFGIKPAAGVNATPGGGSFFGGLSLAPSTTPAPLNLMSSAVGSTATTSLFGQNLAASVATNLNVSKEVTGGLNFAQKNDAVTKSPVVSGAGLSITSSLFASKLNEPAVAEVPPAVTSSTVGTISGTESGGGLFKSIPASNSFSSLGSGISAPTAQPVATASAPVIPASSSLFGKSLPISTAAVVSSVATAATPTTTIASVFGTSSLFGKPPSTSGTVGFGTPLTSNVSSLFGSTPAATVASSSTAPTSNVFSSFSFTKQTPPSTVTISEITSEDASEAEAEPATAEPANSAINTFSFASPTTKPEPTSTEAVTVTTPVSTSTFGTPSTPVSIVNAAPVMVTPTASSAPATNTVTTASAFSGSFFGGLSISATTTTASSTGSLFGQPTTTSVFGNNLFSQQTNATAATSATESKPIFGSGQPLFGQGNAAGQENKSLFGQNNAASQPAKGIFGQSVAANQENKGLFGQPANAFQSGGGSVFGGNSGTSSIFGGSGVFSGGAAAATTPANTFGSSGGGSLFGSGSFTSTPANSSFQGTPGGFGSPPSFSSATQQQGAAGFGSPPAFSNVFKSNNQFSTFGNAPTFGGSPTFGNSPTKLFGQNTPQMATFGNTAQQPTAFDSLANENTMTFGNLAQQPPQPGFGSPPTFGVAAPTPPSFGGSGFGGQSFSSWR